MEALQRIIIDTFAWNIMKKKFGYECEELRVEKVDDRAQKLVSRYKALADKYEVKVPIYE